MPVSAIAELLAVVIVISIVVGMSKTLFQELYPQQLSLNLY